MCPRVAMSLSVVVSLFLHVHMRNYNRKETKESLEW